MVLLAVCYCSSLCIINQQTLNCAFKCTGLQRQHYSRIDAGSSLYIWLNPRILDETRQFDGWELKSKFIRKLLQSCYLLCLRPPVITVYTRLQVIYIYCSLPTSEPDAEEKRKAKRQQRAVDRTAHLHCACQWCYHIHAHRGNNNSGCGSGCWTNLHLDLNISLCFTEEKKNTVLIFNTYWDFTGVFTLKVFK